MLHRFTLFCLIGFFLSNCSNQPGKSDAVDPMDAFAKRIHFDVVQDNQGSISWCVFKGDTILEQQAVGMADVEKKIKADTETIYRIASITKSITAITLLRMRDLGMLNLRDPVYIHFPEITQLAHPVGVDPKEITFFHLANHTSGIDREPAIDTLGSGPYSRWQSLVGASTLSTAMHTKPGTHFLYSNIGYAYLGMAMSRVAKEPFESLVKQLTLIPLHMTSTFFRVEPKLAQLAQGSRWHPFKGITDRAIPFNEHSGRGYKVPNGGLYSTPSDLARFVGGILSNHFLSEESKQQVIHISTPESEDYGYSLGFYVRKNDKGIHMIEQDGGVSGYQANLVFHPGSKLGVVLCRNYSLGLTHMLLEPRTLLAELVRTKATAQAVN